MPACHAGDRRFESGRVRHLRISLRPVRPPGRGVPLPGPGCRTARRPIRATSVTLRPVKRTPAPDRARPRSSSPLVAVLAAGQFGLVGGVEPAASPTARRPRSLTRPPGRRRRPSTARRRCRRGSPSPTPSAAPRPRPRPPRIADVPIVPVTNFRSTPTRDHAPRSVDGGPGRHEQPLRRRSSSSTARPTRSSRALGVADRRSGPRRSSLADGRDDPRRRPRQEPQAARLPARRRGRAGGPRAGLGRRRRCSASIGSRRSPTGR